MKEKPIEDFFFYRKIAKLISLLVLSTLFELLTNK
jgi:hypothetical protein